jgi:hypothetical protein
MTDAMKVTDFMLNLSKMLMEQRNIVESTATQYLQTLFKLNGSKPFNNLAFTKKFDVVQAIIDGYSKSTQGTQYMVLSSVLSLFADKPSYKASYNHWKVKMMEFKKERDQLPPNQKSERQEENWITWDDVVKKKSALNTELSSFISNKNITQQQFEKMLQYVLMCLYTDIQPRRNQDYLYMYVVKKMPKEPDTNKNYYDLSTHKFHFFKYKTQKKWGQQTEDVPEVLQQVLGTFFKHHPLAKNKEFKLLVKSDGSPLNTVNSITRILNRVFGGKKIGSSMLRHIFLSNKYGPMISEMKEDQQAMSHSANQQLEYIKV